MAKPRAVLRAVLHPLATCLLLGLPSLLQVGCQPDVTAPPEVVPPLTTVSAPLPYVDPFIGSGGFGFRLGSAFPGATAPSGLCKVGPDTRGPFGTVRFLHFNGYWYGDDYIQGFSHLHFHGTGAPDYSVLSVMPLPSWDATRTKAPTADDYESKFQKASESAHPGNYAVTLDRGRIRAELTATLRAAHHRYTFGAGTSQRVVLFDLNKHLEGAEIDRAEVRLDAATQTLRGSLHHLGGMSRGFGGYTVYFAARTRTPWASAWLWSAGKPPARASVATPSASGQEVGCALLFDADGTPVGESELQKPIELQVGVSLVSEQSAEQSLQAELPSWQFDQTQKQTASDWEKHLQVAQVTGGSERERRIFYSSLYKALLMPSVHSDGKGDFLGFDGRVGNAPDYRYVSDLSLWDTYRTANPLYALLYPELARDVARSLHQMAKTSGAFPKWPLAGGDSGSMIGAPAEVVLADSHLKGVPFDAAGAFATLRAAAMDEPAPAGGRGGRNNVDSYMKLGYVPARIGGSVSLTTEYARGDFALSELAESLGEKQVAQALRTRSQSYRRLYDAKTGFLRARADDGSFGLGSFDATRYSNDYTEANAWQSLWMNDHDAGGLATLLGGPEQAVSKLEEMFRLTKQEFDGQDPQDPTLGADRPSYYWHGNEGDLHAAYLFALLGRPELTQKWSRWLLTAYYSDKPDGLSGNDDGGTLASWYVLSALGMFPLAGSDTYILGMPLFPRVQLQLKTGAFTVEAVDAQSGELVAAVPEDAKVERITLDGAQLPQNVPLIRHRELRAGGVLRFHLRRK